jgi:hypothetical protein
MLRHARMAGLAKLRRRIRSTDERQLRAVCVAQHKGGNWSFAASAQSLDTREESSHSGLDYSICLSGELVFRVDRLCTLVGIVRLNSLAILFERISGCFELLMFG